MPPHNHEANQYQESPISNLSTLTLFFLGEYSIPKQRHLPIYWPQNYHQQDFWLGGRKKKDIIHTLWLPWSTLSERAVLNECFLLVWATFLILKIFFITILVCTRRIFLATPWLDIFQVPHVPFHSKDFEFCRFTPKPWRGFSIAPNK